MPMTWEDVIKRTDIIGGVLVVNDDKHVYRGPISGIQIEGKRVCIKLLWTARKKLKLGKSWRNGNNERVFVSTKIRPRDIGDGWIVFNVSDTGCSIIYPKGVTKLDPTEVRGLKLK